MSSTHRRPTGRGTSTPWRTTTIAAVITAVGASALASGCGQTYDLAATSTTTETTDTVAVETTPVVDTDSSTEELLDALISQWQGLDDAAIDADRPALERLQEIWALLEERLRSERPELVYGFEQALALAESALEYRRPADASKGYAIAARLAGQYRSDP